MDIIDTNLSTADTESLLAVMVSGVEEVRLGMDVTLDMEMLAQYDGKGECGRVVMRRGARTRYLEQMMSWMKRIDWNLVKANGMEIIIARKASA